MKRATPGVRAPLLMVWMTVAWLLMGAGGLARLRAQQAPSSASVYVGIIVTRSEAAAQACLKQLNGGFDFGVLAKEASIDQSAEDGGFVGRREMAQLPTVWSDALRAMHGGRYTGVVQLPEGFAILTTFPADPTRPDLNAERKQLLAMQAPVRQSINVAGLSEEDNAFGQYEKPQGWQLDLSKPCEIRNAVHQASIKSLEASLAAGADGKAKPIEMLRDHVALAQFHTFEGDMGKAIDDWQKAYGIAQKDVPGIIPYLQEALGVSYLHLSEMENGVYHDPGAIDIFPPREHTAPFKKTEDSRLAIQYLQSFLDKAPEDLQVKWLLNLAYVTLGEYPAGVPTKYLIAESYFNSKGDVGRFTDVAKAAGLNVFSAAGGAVVDDFDNDGLLDVITSTTDMCDSLHFFHNNGDGTFTDRTEQAGLAHQLGGLNLVEADYNNDGCMDLLVLRGGWEYPTRMSLLRNNCNGMFTDVTHKAGLDKVVAATQTAVWADIDNDGYLDLFVGNENVPSQLFRNKGDGTFEDISHKAGVDKTAFTKGVVAADYDKDGYVDFYLSNFEGANVLYRNNHDLTFTDVARQAGVQEPFMSFATWFFDYDNDGWPDLFVTSYNSYTLDQTLRSYLGLPVHVEMMKLYRNMHDGTFKNVTEQTGLNKVLMPMGANFGDVDNDGYLDMYLGMGQPSFADMMPHMLLRNDGGKSFVDITASSGTGELHKGHGIAFADLERDGHEDIVAETGGAVPSDKHAMRVFRNPGNDNDWINVKLVGVKSNRAAVGAEIKVTVADDGGAPRSIYRTVGDTSSFGGNPMEQHIGLGHGAGVVALDVWWPASNSRQHFSNVDKDEFLVIKEFDQAYTKLEVHPVRLGGQVKR